MRPVREVEVEVELEVGRGSVITGRDTSSKKTSVLNVLSEISSFTSTGGQAKLEDKISQPRENQVHPLRNVANCWI